MGLKRAYRLGSYESHHMKGKPQRDKTTFMRGVDPLRHHLKILIWQLQER